MALITDKTKIKLISGLSPTSDIFSSDLFLIQRGFKSYKINYTDLTSNISDLIQINNNSVDTPQLVDGSVTSEKIKDYTIKNIDISSNANIAGGKIEPAFFQKEIFGQKLSLFGNGDGQAIFAEGNIWMKSEDGGNANLRLHDGTTGVPASSYGDISYTNNTLSINVDLLSSYTSENADFLIAIKNRSAFVVREDLTAQFFGSVSKPSGAFKIDHPVSPDEKYLVHSFVESPQADNIYRGTVALSSGTATVNIDSASRMSEGAFVGLNGNTQCFTNNESGWSQVRGNLNGNILTIESQDPNSTDIISWLVIGERHDNHMIETSWTDENGRVITEPLK